MGRRQGLFTLHRGEDGVTAVIVALCLVGLVGMMVLVVDVGALLWKRREMVSGADAAALAAAKTCSVDIATDPSDPQAQANSAAIANVTGLTSSNLSGWTTSPGGCSASIRTPSGYVTVKYSYPQQTFFAGIFGSSFQTVTTQATAAWGPLKTGNAVPVVLESSMFQSSCDVPNVDPDTICAFWYDNTNGASQGANGIGVGGFGFLNLDTWGIDRYSNNCPDGGNTVGNYIKYNYNGGQALSLKQPPPTYVCLDNGLNKVDWFSNLCARWSEVIQPPNSCAYVPDPKTPYEGWPGNELLMPVNDCNLQVNNKGDFVPCGGSYSNVDKFAIMGFTTLALGDVNNPTVPAVLKGDDARAIGTAGASAVCATTLGPAGSGAYGNGGWNADTLAQAPPCTAPTTPAAISDVKITGPKGGKAFEQCTPTTLSATCDYVWNDLAHTIDWYNPATRDGADTYEVSFTWTLAATPGYCGVRSKDSSALCIVTTWKGFASLDGEVGIGRDLGTRGFVLCDFDYSSCPAGVKP